MKIILLTSLAFVLVSQSHCNSCVGRCGYGTDAAYTCQCNPACERYGDCCSDYQTVCKASATSCSGRCGEAYNAQNPCHCNSQCTSYNNCCSDYSSLCGGGSTGTGTVITDSDLTALSEVLYTLDSNKASMSEVILNPQALVADSQTGAQADLSPNKLFEFVDEAALFSRPTFAAFRALLDNYSRQTGITENFSASQLAEQDHFINECISNTEVGRELYAFLYTKGVYQTEEEFKSDLKQMWFGLYSRYNGQLDSSGFEHIFGGEIKNGKVSGFHNWLRFYELEKQGLLNYYSHSFNGPWTTYPDVLGMQFHWDGYFKQVGSAIIGCSPEFDLAVYTLCFVARPGKQCKLSLGGSPLIIQTYTWENSFYGNGKKFIASAYPSSP